MPGSQAFSCELHRQEDRELGATVDRITTDINAAKEGVRVNSDVQRRNEGNISNLGMQVHLACPPQYLALAEKAGDKQLKYSNCLSPCCGS